MKIQKQLYTKLTEKLTALDTWTTTSIHDLFAAAELELGKIRYAISACINNRCGWWRAII